MDKSEILDYLREIKSELTLVGIKKIGLFGSYAKNKESSSSDIDIVYESSEEFINKFRGWSAFTYLNEHIREKVSNKFGLKVDMFDLNSDSSIKNKIEKEAIYV